MSTTMTITDALVMGNHDRAELASMFRVSEEEIAEVQIKNERMLNDTSVSEEQYQEWCDEQDQCYGEVFIQ